MFISILSFLFVFTIIALTHELGHLIWAKRAGIRVFEFGMGFGPRLFSINRNNTLYSLNLIPILAYVRIAGEGESEEDAACPDNEKYQAKTPWQKFKALSAGPFMNILTALLILIALFAIVGIPAGPSNEIGAINQNSPAEKAGLKVGDRVVAINGTSYAKMEGIIKVIHKSRDKRLALTVERKNKTLSIKATPKYNQKLKVALLGFTPKPIYKGGNLITAVYQGFVQTGSMIVVTLYVLWQLITGGVSLADVAGPIGIAQITGKYAQTGFVSLMSLTAFISVNIGILNLLPIPALDGGRIVFVIIEWIRGKALDSKLENKIHYWGMVALLILMGLISIGDLWRIFGRQ
jgi:regulator of sigma E protease